MKSNVYIYQTRIPKYREVFFAHLISLGRMDNIEYKIVVAENRLELFSHESKMSQGVINVRIRKLKLLGRELHIHQKINLHKDADLVVCEYGLKTLLVYYLLFLRKPKIFAFWGHGQTTTRATFKIENLLQQKMLRYADYFLAYTESCSNLITSFGFPSSRIQVLNNSIDTNILNSENYSGSKILIEDYLEKLELEKNQEILLYMGSLEKDKRIDFVLEAFEQIARVRPGIALFICSQDNFEGRSSQDLPEGAYLLGEADNEMKTILSKLCRLILNPGRVGLIAVDSFAMKIPIVTTNWNRHAPEFSYLKNEVNSLITGNDLESYVQGCLRVLEEPRFRDQLISGCLESADEYTIEKMAANFHFGVLKCLAL
jgi:glycosyltransferase involved in cell wall biosynthesis